MLSNFINPNRKRYRDTLKNFTDLFVGVAMFQAITPQNILFLNRYKWNIISNELRSKDTVLYNMYHKFHVLRNMDELDEYITSMKQEFMDENEEITLSDLYHLYNDFNHAKPGKHNVCENMYDKRFIRTALKEAIRFELVLSGRHVDVGLRDLTMEYIDAKGTAVYHKIDLDYINNKLLREHYI